MTRRVSPRRLTGPGVLISGGFMMPEAEPEPEPGA
jgi:hypothetical protein